MNVFEHAWDDRARAGNREAPSEPLWQRFLRWFTNSVPGITAAAHPGTARDARHCLPVYRITRVWQHRWVAQTPESSMEHAFDDPASAEAFVRHECAGSPAMVELRIGELYVAAQLDPTRQALFGGLSRAPCRMRARLPSFSGAAMPPRRVLPPIRASNGVSENEEKRLALRTLRMRLIERRSESGRADETTQSRDLITQKDAQ